MQKFESVLSVDGTQEKSIFWSMFSFLVSPSFLNSCTISRWLLLAIRKGFLMRILPTY